MPSEVSRGDASRFGKGTMTGVEVNTAHENPEQSYIPKSLSVASPHPIKDTYSSHNLFHRIL